MDAALGAEEMVEKLTDTNLELEGKMEAMSETEADLEALRDLSEEQEELRMEVEHDLREELDMSLNSVRQVGGCGFYKEMMQLSGIKLAAHHRPMSKHF